MAIAMRSASISGPSGTKASIVLNAAWKAKALSKKKRALILAKNEADYTEDETLIINVGGVRHETFWKTLQTRPGTRLANLTKDDPHYRPQQKEFFFDRFPGPFPLILNYYRTGRLHVPNDVCGPVVEEELEFWGIKDFIIEQCCWIGYCSKKQTLINLSKFDTDMKRGEVHLPKTTNCLENFRRKVWEFLDEPYSSIPAMVFGFVSLLLIFASIFVFCAETTDAFRYELKDEHWAEVHDVHVDDIRKSNHALRNSSAILNGASPVDRNRTNSTGISSNTTDGHSHPHYPKSSGYFVNYEYLKHMDMACTAFFTFELLLRIIFCPRKVVFFTSVLNIIDLLAILPLYVEMIIHELDPAQEYLESEVDFIAIFHVMRVLRIFRLMKHLTGVQVLVYTLKYSLKELLLVLVFLGIGVLIFSALIYYADKQDKITNIPLGFWWALVTITTVGYGDMYPVTGWGYVVGSLCAISGLLLIGFTIPIIVNNFVMYFQHATANKLREHELGIDKMFSDDVITDSHVNNHVDNHVTYQGKSEKKHRAPPTISVTIPADNSKTPIDDNFKRSPSLSNSLGRRSGNLVRESDSRQSRHCNGHVDRHRLQPADNSVEMIETVDPDKVLPLLGHITNSSPKHNNGNTARTSFDSLKS